jgi:hypothetical protein
MGTEQDLNRDESAHLETIRDRDYYHEVADKLAAAIAAHFGIDIGEHASDNDPWQNALDAVPDEPPLANDWTLPGDFTCRGATFRKGVHVRSIVGRMERLYDAAFPGVAELSQLQIEKNLATLQNHPDPDELKWNFLDPSIVEPDHVSATQKDGVFIVTIRSVDFPRSQAYLRSAKQFVDFMKQ